MDQMAKKAMPITAKVEENTTARVSRSTPRMKDSTKEAMRIKATLKYRTINFILASLIPLFLPTFRIS